MERALDMSLLPFRGISDVEENDLPFVYPLSEGRYVDNRGSLNLKLRCLLGSDSTGEITL